MVSGAAGWCPVDACCLICRGTTDLRVVVRDSPAGPLCVTLDDRCARGPALRLTLDAVARLAAEHREHDAARDAEVAGWTAERADDSSTR